MFFSDSSDDDNSIPIIEFDKLSKFFNFLNAENYGIPEELYETHGFLNQTFPTSHLILERELSVDDIKNLGKIFILNIILYFLI